MASKWDRLNETTTKEAKEAEKKAAEVAAVPAEKKKKAEPKPKTAAALRAEAEKKAAEAAALKKAADEAEKNEVKEAEEARKAKAAEEARKAKEAEEARKAEEAKKAGKATLSRSGVTGPRRAWGFHDEKGNKQVSLSYGVASYYEAEPWVVPVWVENGEIIRTLKPSEAAAANL